MPEATPANFPLQLFAPYRRRGAKRLRDDQFIPVRNWDPVRHVKPQGGVWTSTYTPDAPTDSDWLRFCQEEHPDWIPAFGYLYLPTPNVKIWVIHSTEDVQELLEHYPRVEGRMIDFERVSQDFDAIHLANATLGARDGHPNLHFWDSECSVWFRSNALEYKGRIRLCRQSAPKHPPPEL